MDKVTSDEDYPDHGLINFKLNPKIQIVLKCSLLVKNLVRADKLILFTA